MGFFDRLKNAWFLFMTSLAFLKRDKSLLAVPVLLPFVNLGVFLLFVAIMFALVFTGMGTVWEGYAGIWSFVFLIVLFFTIFLVNTFFGAAQCWMVYEVARGKDTTLASGVKRAWHNLGDVLKFALVITVIHIITGALRGQRREGIDINYALRSTLAGGIETLAGILGKLVLPAMIVTEKTFGEAVADLKRSLKTWPEILAFELGLGPLIGVVLFFGIVLMFVITYPLLIMAPMLGIVFSSAYIILLIMTISIFSSFINATYYTLLYLALVEKKHIKHATDVFYRKF